jgi:hypothetical protein
MRIAKLGMEIEAFPRPAGTSSGFVIFLAHCPKNR